MVIQFTLKTLFQIIWNGANKVLGVPVETSIQIRELV